MATRKFTWFLHIATCYRKGYEAGLAGADEDDCPYQIPTGSHGKGVQLQRMRAWLRGWKRAMAGLPLDDSNG